MRGTTRTVDGPDDPGALTRAVSFVNRAGDYILATGHHEYLRQARTGRTRSLLADDSGMNAFVFDRRASTAAFESFGADWAPGDPNVRGDVFVVRLAATKGAR